MPPTVGVYPSVDLTEIQLANYRADILVLLYDGDAPVRVVVVEVQLAKDLAKRRSWPAYVSIAHARNGCLVDLLVVGGAGGSDRR
jgi:hypothetical protein